MLPSINCSRLVKALFATAATLLLVDSTYTLRFKTLLVRALPLGAENKIEIVGNLCDAAYAGAPTEASRRCRSAYESAAAREEVGKINQLRAICRIFREEKESEPKGFVLVGDQDPISPYFGEQTYMYFGKNKAFHGFILNMENCEQADLSYCKKYGTNGIKALSVCFD